MLLELLKRSNTYSPPWMERERKLHDKADIMICDSAKGDVYWLVFLEGLSLGLQRKLKTIFIESALFNPVSIRKTAKRPLV